MVPLDWIAIEETKNFNLSSTYLVSEDAHGRSGGITHTRVADRNESLTSYDT